MLLTFCAACNTSLPSLLLAAKALLSAACAPVLATGTVAAIISAMDSCWHLLSATRALTGSERNDDRA